MSTPTPLAEFLRARREQLSPADVGLRSGGRRRTPGLRREEVATLAGVSIDYLVRLEQGRDTNPSPAVLSAIGAALRLNERDRHHLAVLAMQTSSGDFCPGGHGAASVVPDTVLVLLEGLGATPAFVTGPYGDILGWNPAWNRIAEPMGFVEGERPNLVRFAFTHPAAADVLVDWEQVADQQVAAFRHASVPWRDDESLIALLAEMQSVPAFAERWSTHQLTDGDRSDLQLRHPEHGILTIHEEVLQLAGDNGQHLIVWMAADEATAAAFVEAAIPVVAGAPRLRVVSGS